MIILVHDLGTSSNKAALYSEDGELIAAASQSYSTFETQHGASEQNPAEWLQAVASTTKRVILTSGIRSSDIEAICVSGHMMGVIALDSHNLPIRSAILHGDTRSHPQVKAIAEHMPASRAHQISGNPLDVHYPLSKIAWLRDNEPSVYKEVRVFVQSKDYITGWLTGRDAVTDYSDASLYGCFDFHTMTWSEELCQAAGIDMGKLPRILQAGSVVGKLCSEAAKALDIASGIPVYLGFGDGAAAAYGAGAWEPGSCYNYVGSTAWVAATTAIPAIDPDERLFTIALTSERFSSIGTVQCAGTAWEWAVTRLCDSHFETAESLVLAAPAGSNGLIFLPYLSGERSPIWNERARGVWFGLSAGHSQGDLLRSVLEGVALSLESIYVCISQLTGTSPPRIQLIGGALRNKLWRRILTAAYGVDTGIADDMTHATARGAFIAAAVGARVIAGFDDAGKLAMPSSTLAPDAKLAVVYATLQPLFAQIYEQLKPSFDDLSTLRMRLASLEESHATI